MSTLRVVALIVLCATLAACSSLGRDRIGYEHTFKIQFDPHLHDEAE